MNTHKLFKQFPLSGNAVISTGNVPTPYHIYNGFGLFIGGVCNLSEAKKLLATENLMPVQTTDGKALMGIWICNFTEASLNPHHELQFSIFVSRKEIAPLQPHAFNTLLSHILHPEVEMLCQGLWNNTPEVVAYNTELLYLTVQQSDSVIGRVGKKIEFIIKDSTSNQQLVSGSVKSGPSLSATLSYFSKLGFKKQMELARQPWMKFGIVNPISDKMKYNAVAQSFVKNKQEALHLFSADDAIEIDHPLYKSLKFVPEVVHFMDGIQMVYLQPE